MGALVGIDAAVLVAAVSASQFNSGVGGNPIADELPTVSADGKTWSWENPDSLASPNDVSPWTLVAERNEFSLDTSVDVAERKPFVASLEEAWVKKARTWMNWSGSLSGFYDDADNTLFNTMKAGEEVWLIFFDSREISGSTATTPSTYWLGKALLTNVSHSVGSEDFATLDCDFEGSGPLYRSAVPDPTV